MTFAINPKHAFVTRSMCLLLILLLPSCVSLAGKAPPSLLILTADQSVSSGTQRSGAPSESVVVLIPDVPRKIDTNRIPVQVDASQIAYLKDAFWADKPARLMQQLLVETIRAKSARLVLTEVEAGGKAERMISGSLMEFGIDASRSEAVVVFDAVKQVRGRALETKRFEARKPIGIVNAVSAGSALNQAANQIAVEIAAWTE
jgi:cholesterol transport system auxiliary component